MSNSLPGSKDANRRDWDKVRARGHTQFILCHGLLRRGLPFGLVVTLGPALYDLVTSSTVVSAWTLAGYFACFTVVFGYGMGEAEWKKRERAYHEGHLE
jgi:hypothetical protein